MKYFLVLTALLLVITMPVLVARAFPPNETVLHEDLPNEGVMTVDAGSLGHYAIDTRFDLCFLIGKERQIVQISCEPFDNLHGNSG